jgi:DNA primase
VQKLDTPERRAALERRIEEKIRTIAERSVQEHYRRFFRERLFQTWRQKPKAVGRGPRARDAYPTQTIEIARKQPNPRALHLRRQQEIAIALLINHPALLDDVAEDFAALDLPASDLDGIRQEILKIFGSRQDLDGAVLKLHLCRAGFTRIVEDLLSPRVYVHAGFARPDADPETIRRGWIGTRNWLKQQPELNAQIGEAERRLAEDMTNETWARTQALVGGRREEDEATDDPF